MKTNQDVQFIHKSNTGQFVFFAGQELNKFDTIITIPKGTRVTNKTALGIDKNYHFVDDLSFLKKDEYGLRHDLTYHGANVPKQFIEY